MERTPRLAAALPALLPLLLAVPALRGSPAAGEGGTKPGIRWGGHGNVAGAGGAAPPLTMPARRGGTRIVRRRRAGTRAHARRRCRAGGPRGVGGRPAPPGVGGPFCCCFVPPPSARCSAAVGQGAWPPRGFVLRPRVALSAGTLLLPGWVSLRWVPGTNQTPVPTPKYL